MRAGLVCAAMLFSSAAATGASAFLAAAPVVRLGPPHDPATPGGARGEPAALNGAAVYGPARETPGGQGALLLGALAACAALVRAGRERRAAAAAISRKARVCPVETSGFDRLASSAAATALPSRTLGSALVGGASKRAWRAARRGSSALVLRAHKKTSASTKNQGHSLLAHNWGLSKGGLQGNAVRAGTRLCKQKGKNWYPGANVGVGKDHSLVALRDGIVQWVGGYRHRTVCVVPWEHVREKATWTNQNTLGAVAYQPWMGANGRSGKNRHTMKLREEWLQTEEGKEWLKKKEEKKEKQRAIQKKIRAIRKARREGREPAKEDAPKEAGPEPIGAVGDSESELEP